MERTSIIKNFLELVGLTKKERIVLLQELVKEWNLTEADVFGSANDSPVAETIVPAPDTTSNTIDTPTVKRRGRRKKSEEEAPSPEPPSGVTETPVAKKRGRKKKSETNITEPPVAKRRGRPKKVVAADECPLQDSVPPQDSVSPEDAALIEEVAMAKNIADVLDDEPEIRSKESRRRNSAFCYWVDYPALAKFVVGQKYGFEFLYIWENKKLLSPFVLSGLMPVGIYIPYQNTVFGKYRGFIVSIYEEKVIENVNAASEEAKKISPIDDENWAVMDSLQWSVLKNYSSTINRMLSKVGGDLLHAQYKTLSPKTNTVCGVGMFRYTVSVK